METVDDAGITIFLGCGGGAGAGAATGTTSGCGAVLAAISGGGVCKDGLSTTTGCIGRDLSCGFSGFCAREVLRSRDFSAPWLAAKSGAEADGSDGGARLLACANPTLIWSFTFPTPAVCEASL